jgi:serine/threonine-protein phosphatase 6 regulatory ankyrin repeat subunit B
MYHQSAAPFSRDNLLLSNSLSRDVRSPLAIKNPYPIMISALKNDARDLFYELLATGFNPYHVDIHQNTVLHWAAKLGYEQEVITLLVKTKLNANSVNSYGETPLMLAASEGYLSIVKNLIAHDADINRAADNGEQALHFALRAKHTLIAAYLLNHTDTVKQKNQLPLALRLASKNGLLIIVEHLLTYKFNFDEVNGYFYAAIHYAASYGFLKIVKTLHQHNVDLNLQGMNNETPIYFAAINGHDRVVEYLIRNGVDQSLIDSGFCTPVLIVATKHDYREVIQLLLQTQLSINKVDKNKKTAIYYAVFFGRIEVIRLFLMYKGSLNLDYEESEILYQLALTKGHQLITQLFDDGPLLYALKSSDDQMALTLLTYLEYQSLLKNGTLLLIALKNCDEIVSLRMIALNANIQCSDEDGSTPLHLAVKKDFKNVLKLLLKSFIEKRNCISYCLRFIKSYSQHHVFPLANIDIDAEDNEGNSALDLALKMNSENQIDIIDLFFKTGCCMNVYQDAPKLYSLGKRVEPQGLLFNKSHKKQYSLTY